MRDFAVQRAEAARQRQLPPLCRPAARAPWCGTWWPRPSCRCTLKTWCFPVMGCVGYRGYFDRAEADALAAQLRAEGWEVSVYGVPAYSTLGWTQLDGRRPAAQHLRPLARRRAGAADLPRAGAPGGLRRRRHHVQRVLRHRGRAHRRRGAGWSSTPAPQARAEYAALRRAAAGLPRADADAAASELEALYASALPRRRQARSARPRVLAAHARRLRGAQGRSAGAALPATTAGSRAPTMPRFGVLAAYNELVPAFERLFERRAATSRASMPRCSALGGLAEGRAPRHTRCAITLTQDDPAMADIRIHREHQLGLAKARKVAWAMGRAGGAEVRHGMHGDRGRDQRHGGVHAHRRQRPADRGARPLRPGRQARLPARRLQQDHRDTRSRRTSTPC